MTALPLHRSLQKASKKQAKKELITIVRVKGELVSNQTKFASGGSSETSICRILWLPL